MAAFKKQPRRRENPSGRAIKAIEDPNSYYIQHPSWCFSRSDKVCWPFNAESAGDSFWESILPRLQGLESQTWGMILVDSKKQNHSIDTGELNPAAQRRLVDLCIEADSIISLRIDGTHRLYGYMVGPVFNLVWYDPDHGDNDTCVCRSYQKHT